MGEATAGSERAADGSPATAAGKGTRAEDLWANQTTSAVEAHILLKTHSRDVKDRPLPRSTCSRIRGIRPEGRRSQVEPRPKFTRVERGCGLLGKS